MVTNLMIDEIESQLFQVFSKTNWLSPKISAHSIALILISLFKIGRNKEDLRSENFISIIF